MSCEKNGVKVRLIVELDDPKLLPFIKRFSATETRTGRLSSKGRMIVQKEKQMIMSDSATSAQMSANSESDSSLCTDSNEMVDNIFSLCTFLWETSQPLKTMDVKNFVRKIKN